MWWTLRRPVYFLNLRLWWMMCCKEKKSCLHVGLFLSFKWHQCLLDSCLCIYKFLFPIEPKCRKKLAGWRCQRSHQGPWETECNLLGIHSWRHVINCCCRPDKSQLKRGIIGWCFVGCNQSPETHVSLNVILRLIGPPRGCPLKAMRFSLKTFPGLHPKGCFPLPTNPTDPDPVIYGWGPLPQITEFEKNPSMDEKETRPPDCSRGKCHS